MFLSPRWIIFLGMFLVLATLVANTIDAAAPVDASLMVSSTTNVTMYSVIQKFELVKSSTTLGTIDLAFSIIPDLFTLLLKMILWDYNFLNNFVGIIIKLLMWSISIAILIWLALALKPK